MSNRLTYDEVKTIFNNHNFKLLTKFKSYKNSSQKLIGKSLEGYLFKTIAYRLNKNNKPDLWHKLNIYSIKNIKLWLKLNSIYKLKTHQKYVNSSTKMIFICPICGEFKQKWNSIRRGVKCSICTNRVVKVGVNDVSTTHPEIMIYLKNKNIGRKHTKGSILRTVFVCPICGLEKKMSINNFISNERFSCSICSDGISIPNKFLFSVFNQLNLDIKPEKRFKGIDYRYDLYVKTKENNYTIEVHGIQHYKENNIWKQTLKNQQNNDNKKRIFSESLNNIHIEIDCRYSKFDYMKNEFIKSLSSCFDLSNINWDKVYEDCFTNKILEICELWNEQKTIKYITKKIKVSEVTIRKYLKIGTQIGLCIYESEKQKLNGPKSRIKKVSQYTIEGKFLKQFDSIKQASLETGCNGISQCCMNKIAHIKGFNWKYS